MATYVDFEGIPLREISQRKTNTRCSHLYVGSKETEPTQRLEGWVPGAGDGEMLVKGYELPAIT